MTLAQTIRQWRSELEAAGVPDAAADAEWIACEVTGLNRVRLRLEGQTALTDTQRAHAEQLLARRKRREPLQYILGRQNFAGLELKTDARALIPRPETELLAERCVRAVRESGADRFALLDLCTGSGALALYAAFAEPRVFATGTDISEEALSLARENAACCRLEARTEFWQSDLFENLRGRVFDGIVSNPPYVPDGVIDSLEPEVARYEPRMALSGGAQGYDFYDRIVPQAPAHLRAGGFLALEAEPFQFPHLFALAEAAGFGEPDPVPDYSGQIRACLWYKK